MTLEPCRLDALELASGIVLGLDTASAPLPGIPRALTPRVALEQAVLPALERPPCLVSFSGGRDSSAVLAAAVAAARRKGLPPPIPATNRFPGEPLSDETKWQERVVQHLGLADWERLEHETELDCIGPVAQRLLREHGLLWPFNSHFHDPLLALAAGGSLLTGIGGDELLGTAALDRVTALLALRVRPERRDLLRIGYGLAPRAARRSVLRRRGLQPFPWLRPAAQQEFLERWVRAAAAEPLRWGARLRNVGARRYLQVGVRSLDVLAGDHDVRIAHPLTNAQLVAALARLPWRGRFRDRNEAMRLVVGEALPEDVLARRSKASFDGAFWNAPSRAFASAWDGSGVDPEVVDVDALRREWRAEHPPAQSFLLLQAAWLNSHGRGTATESSEQAVGRVA